VSDRVTSGLGVNDEAVLPFPGDAGAHAAAAAALDQVIVVRLDELARHLDEARGNVSRSKRPYSVPVRVAAQRMVLAAERFAVMVEEMSS
jgi:hypothetical protein